MLIIREEVYNEELAKDVEELPIEASKGDKDE